MHKQATHSMHPYRRFAASMILSLYLIYCDLMDWHAMVGTPHFPHRGEIEMIIILTTPCHPLLVYSGWFAIN